MEKERKNHQEELDILFGKQKKYMQLRGQPTASYLVKKKGKIMSKRVIRICVGDCGKRQVVEGGWVAGVVGPVKAGEKDKMNIILFLFLFELNAWLVLWFAKISYLIIVVY
ncbi:hypothetical protein Hanom_Chr09g00766501 [Helianthus anomalus]